MWKECTLHSLHMRTGRNTWSLHVLELWNILEHSFAYVFIFQIVTVLVSQFVQSFYWVIAVQWFQSCVVPAAQFNSANMLCPCCATLYTCMEYVIYLILMVDICFFCNQMLYHRNMPLLAGNEQWCPARWVMVQLICVCMQYTFSIKTWRMENRQTPCA